VEKDLAARSMDCAQEKQALLCLEEAVVQVAERVGALNDERDAYLELGKKKFAVSQFAALEASLQYLHGVHHSKKKKCEKLLKKKSSLEDDYEVAQEDEDTTEITKIAAELEEIEVKLHGPMPEGDEASEQRAPTGAVAIQNEVHNSLMQTSELIKEVMGKGMKATGVYEAICHESEAAEPRYISEDPSRPPVCYVVRLPGNEIEMTHPLPALDLKILKQASVMHTKRVNKYREAMKAKEQECKRLDAEIQAREQTLKAIRARGDATPRGDAKDDAETPA